jgi:hypothetical protein
MYYAGSTALNGAHRGETAAEAAAGKPVIKNLMWDGAVSPGFYFEPPLFNILHPEVQRDLIAYVEDAADRYSRFPALEGISLLVGEGNCVWFGSIQSGYDDLTVGLFERETGIRVPADTAGGARFSQRFRWLNQNAYEEWISWRCKRIHDLFADIARRIQRRRPDLKLYLTFYAIDGHMSNPFFRLDTWRPEGRSTDQIYREGGFDTRLYRNDPNIVLRRVAYPIDYRFFKAHYAGTGGPNSHPILARDVELLSEGIGPFKNSAIPAIAFHCRYFESSIGHDKPIPGQWWTDHPWRVSQPAASGRNYLEFYAQTLAELDATSFAYGGYTVLTLGHEEEVRDFARALRPLPRLRFQPVPAMADPVCARHLRHRGTHYLYLVNRMAVPAQARVVFGGRGVVLRDLRDGSPTTLGDAVQYALPAPMPARFVSEHDLPAEAGPLPDPDAPPVHLSGSLLSISLPPFALRSFAIEPESAEILYASSDIPQEEKTRIAARLAERRQVVANAQAPESVVAEARKCLDLAERALRKREYSRASLLLESFPLARLVPLERW